MTPLVFNETGIFISRYVHAFCFLKMLQQPARKARFRHLPHNNVVRWAHSYRNHTLIVLGNFNNEIFQLMNYLASVLVGVFLGGESAKNTGG